VSDSKSEKEFLLIGELAELTAVSRDTLRHYERKGVLPRPNRSPKGYRLYSAKTLERVQMIRRALAVGFTLDELARILAERERGNAPCQAVHTLAVRKLEEVNNRLKEIEKVRNELQNLVGDWDRQVTENEKGEPIHLLENLTITTKDNAQNRSKKLSDNFRRQKNKGKQIK
jgi:DNA-binding transcriptional MerR regulator